MSKRLSDAKLSGCSDGASYRLCNAVRAMGVQNYSDFLDKVGRRFDEMSLKNSASVKEAIADSIGLSITVTPEPNQNQPGLPNHAERNMQRQKVKEMVQSVSESPDAEGQNHAYAGAMTRFAPTVYCPYVFDPKIDRTRWDAFLEAWPECDKPYFNSCQPPRNKSDANDIGDYKPQTGEVDPKDGEECGKRWWKAEKQARKNFAETNM